MKSSRTPSFSLSVSEARAVALTRVHSPPVYVSWSVSDIKEKILHRQRGGMGRFSNWCCFRVRSGTVVVNNLPPLRVPWTIKEFSGVEVRKWTKWTGQWLTGKVETVVLHCFRGE